MGTLITVQSVTLGDSLGPGQVKTPAPFCLPIRLQVTGSIDPKTDSAGKSPS